MNIQVLSSGSTGNCYRVSDGYTNILLECGIPIQKIKEGLNFRLSDITGCLVSHEHKDHAKAVKDISKVGIDVYMSFGTWEALNIKHHRIKCISKQETIKIGTFLVMSFDVQHDAVEPFGYILYSIPTKQKLLYLTDSYYCKYRFNELTHIMIEANYTTDILKDNTKNGLIDIELKNRVMKSHMSIETLKDFLRANELSQVQQIWLLHLSDNNSDAERFKREVQELTGKEVYIA